MYSMLVLEMLALLKLVLLRLFLNYYKYLRVDSIKYTLQLQAFMLSMSKNIYREYFASSINVTDNMLFKLLCSNC